MHIQFAELPVHDQDRARSFYELNLGCELVADQLMGPDGWRWIELRLPGAQTHLHFVSRADDAPAEVPSLVLITDDLDGQVRALAARNVTILTPPGPATYDPSLRVAEFQDSEGNRMVLSSSVNA